MNDSTNIATTAAAMFMAGVCAFYEPLEWWMLLAAALIIADLRFGVLAAKARGEEVRRSRMWRRTLNKAFDYFCWITVAGMCSRTMGKVLGAPVVAVGILLIIYGIEINSCVNNYFEYKGIRKRFNFWKLLKSKARTEVDAAIDDRPDDRAADRPKADSKDANEEEDPDQHEQKR